MEPAFPIITYVNVLRRHVYYTPAKRIVKPATKRSYCSKAYIFKSVVVTVLLCLSAANARSTSIVVIRGPMDITIAADSMGTFDHETRVVCKIHRAQGVFLAIAGFDNDPITKFDVAKVVFSAIRLKTTFKERESAAIESLKSNLQTEAITLKTTRPIEFARFIDPNRGSPSIVLFGMENGAPIAIGLSFQVTESPNGQIAVSLTKSFRCPGDCPTGSYMFMFGKREAIEHFVATHPGYRAGQDAARTFVQLEIDAHALGSDHPLIFCA
jgi:hypothetical protein